MKKVEYDEIPLISRALKGFHLKNKFVLKKLKKIFQKTKKKMKKYKTEKI